MVEAVVEFAYEAEQEDELSLKVGEIIKNVVESDGGWWEGEVNGKKGMFPENFVKILKAEDKNIKKDGIAKKEAPQRKSVRELASKFKDSMPIGGPIPSKKREKRKKCKVLFDYAPENEDELELKEAELIDFIREVEDGWWEGSVNGKNGVFPSNFVEMCEEEENSAPPEVTDKPGSGDEMTTSVHEIKGKKVIGVGLGNIFQGGPIKLRSAGKGEDKKTAEVKEPPIKQPPPEPSKPPVAEPTKPQPHEHPVTTTTSEVVKREKKGNRAVVRFSYTAEQPDELTLKEGETITILDTKLEDDGWWKGEIRGKVGVFPDNFVEFVTEEVQKPKKPPPPSISTIPKNTTVSGGGSAKTGLHAKPTDKGSETHSTDKKHDVKHETKHDAKNDAKHDGKHKTEPPSNKNKEHTESLNDRGPPPVTAAKKPFVPPPVSKKPPPKPDPPKAAETAKVELKHTPTVPVKESKPQEHTEAIEPSEDTESPGDNDQEPQFGTLESTSEKLIHLTASRVKGPKKRPPSTVFNQMENEKYTTVESDEDKASSPIGSAPPVQHNDTRPQPPQKEHKPAVAEHEKKSVEHHSNHHQHRHHNVAPPRPPEPTATPAVSTHHSNSAIMKMVEDLQRDVTELRSTTVSRASYGELRSDYERLKQDMDSFKSSSSKKIRELMMEVDEEKKLRLNTQVEIERIKKLLAETNV